MDMIFYHEGAPGEVSHRAARAYVARLLRNPFCTGRILAGMADYHTARRESAHHVAAGVMTQYLRAAALREATAGES